ncbi:hypothetical protein ACSBR2_005079 [Camellia fascicularis]
MMMDGGEYSADYLSRLNSVSKKKRNKNQRRFSDDQIRSLETMFESESKLEPRKKMQVARELGLQPRQVGIWFQNKRARWKSKQLERDYSVLRADYTTLVSQFEALKKEKRALVLQLQKLNDLMPKSPPEDNLGCRQGVPENNSIGDRLDSGEDFKTEFAVKPSLSMEDDENSNIEAEYFGIDEEPELLNMVEVEPADSSLTSPENWGGFDSDGLLDQSGSSDQWWDFWS